MRSTHKTIDRAASRGVHRRARVTLALALSAAAGLAGGCACKPPAQAEPVSTAPMPIDEAMQARDWPRSEAQFQSGAVAAGATRFRYSPKPVEQGVDRGVLGPERRNAVLDTGYFIGETLLLPFTYIFEPPFVEKSHRGVFYEPTYTAMPILPPDQNPAGSDIPQPAPVIEDEAAVEEMTIEPADPSIDEAPPVDAPLVIDPEPESTIEPSPEPETSVDPAPEPETTIDAAPLPEPEPAFEPIPEPELLPESDAPEPAAEISPEPAPETDFEPAPEIDAAPDDANDANK